MSVKFVYGLHVFNIKISINGCPFWYAINLFRPYAPYWEWPLRSSSTTLSCPLRPPPQPLPPPCLSLSTECYEVFCEMGDGFQPSVCGNGGCSGYVMCKAGFPVLRRRCPPVRPYYCCRTRVCVDVRTVCTQSCR